MVRELITNMKNGKATGPPSVVSEIVKVAGGAGVDMITDLPNQIIVEGFIPTELRTNVNCFIGKADSCRTVGLCLMSKWWVQQKQELMWSQD